MSLIPNSHYPHHDDMPVISYPAPRLPVEVCEQVIDQVALFRVLNWWQRYDTLHSCALVCRSWVPRSRVRLFHSVWLNSKRRASSFLAALSISSGLSQFVQELWIAGSRKKGNSDGWIYDVLRILPKLLKNLHGLIYENLPTLHPIFVPLSSRFTTVKSFAFYGSSDLKSQSFREVIQLVNQFKNLRELTISASWTVTPSPSAWRGRSHSLSKCHLLQENEARWLAASRSTRSLSKLSSPYCPEFEDILQHCSSTLQVIEIVYKRSSLPPVRKYLDVVDITNVSSIFTDLPYLAHCHTLRRLFLQISVLIDVNDILLILKAFPETLPSSLHTIQLNFGSATSEVVFAAETEEDWKALDGTLAEPRFADLASFEIHVESPLEPPKSKGKGKMEIVEEAVEQEQRQDQEGGEEAEEMRSVEGEDKFDEDEDDDYESDEEIAAKRAERELKDLTSLNETVFKKYLPHLYKQGLLWCGFDPYGSVFLVAPTNVESWHSRDALDFDDA